HVRTIRRRALIRESAESRRSLVANERAGDKAVENHFYEEAAHYYQEALQAKCLSSRDRLRISEKVGSALSLTDKPDTAREWFDRVLSQPLTDGNGSDTRVAVLLKVA